MIGLTHDFEQILPYNQLGHKTQQKKKAFKKKKVIKLFDLTTLGYLKGIKIPRPIVLGLR